MKVKQISGFPAKREENKLQYPTRKQMTDIGFNYGFNQALEIIGKLDIRAVNELKPLDEEESRPALITILTELVCENERLRQEDVARDDLKHQDRSKAYTRAIKAICRQFGAKPVELDVEKILIDKTGRIEDEKI